MASLNSKPDSFAEAKLLVGQYLAKEREGRIREFWNLMEQQHVPREKAEKMEKVLWSQLHQKEKEAMTQLEAHFLKKLMKTKSIHDEDIGEFLPLSQEFFGRLRQDSLSQCSPDKLGARVHNKAALRYLQRAVELTRSNNERRENQRIDQSSDHELEGDDDDDDEVEIINAGSNTTARTRESPARMAKYSYFARPVSVAGRPTTPTSLHDHNSSSNFHTNLPARPKTVLGISRGSYQFPASNSDDFEHHFSIDYSPKRIGFPKTNLSNNDEELLARERKKRIRRVAIPKTPSSIEISRRNRSLERHTLSKVTPPGPADYNTNSELVKKHVPGNPFRKEKRECINPLPKNAEPTEEELAADLDKTLLSLTRSSVGQVFSTVPRFKDLSKRSSDDDDDDDDGPGPAAYLPGKWTYKRPPTVRFTKQPKHKNVAPTPGPCSYNTVNAFEHIKPTPLPHHISPHVKGAFREIKITDFEQNLAPGPGYYRPNYSMVQKMPPPHIIGQSKQSRSIITKPNDVPGPGQYYVNPEDEDEWDY